MLTNLRASLGTWLAFASSLLNRSLVPDKRYPKEVFIIADNVTDTNHSCGIREDHLRLELERQPWQTHGDRCRCRWAVE